MKKKVWIIVIAIIAAAILGAGCWFLFKGTGEQSGSDGVFVSKVSELMGLGGAGQGVHNRYAGVVEPQKNLEIELESGRSVAEILVKEGDEVKEGDPLFRYDVEEISMNLEQQKLELERMDNNLESLQQKLTKLEEEKEEASADLQLQYTMEIQQSSAEIKQAEYERKVKAAEIEKSQKSIEQSIVTCTMDGVIRSINENVNNGGAMDYYYGEQDTSFMTILATGEYRVKGTINEQNIYTISTEMPVIIRSRVQEDLTWTGMITEIDTENPEQPNQNMYYGGPEADAALQSSNYPFYIVLDSYEGLMLGQHVYIELGGGAPVHTEGVWVYEGYIMTEEDGTATIWTEVKGEIQKKTVVLGQYDETVGQYEIVEGLSQDDWIAWPEEGIEEGTPVCVS